MISYIYIKVTGCNKHFCGHGLFSEGFSQKIQGFKGVSGAPKGSFRGISVRKALNRLRFSDLTAVKPRDFFGKTSRRTFVTRGIIISYYFRRDKIKVSYQFRRAISSSEIRRKGFCFLKFSAA